MKRRFYFTLLVLALILIALPGFAAGAARRAFGRGSLRPAAARAPSSNAFELLGPLAPSDARTQGAPIVEPIGATEDAAAPRVIAGQKPEGIAGRGTKRSGARPTRRAP